MTVNPWWNGPASYGRMLAATADRERALDVLKAGYAEGRLTKEEHDARAERVHQARTYADLAEVTSDLPGAAPPVPAWPATAPAVIPWPAPEPPPPPGTSSLAVWSLCLAILQVPTLGLTGIPAIIMGHVALRDIRRTGEGGTGLAAAGMVLGSVGAMLTVFVLIVMLSIAVRGA